MTRAPDGISDAAIPHLGRLTHAPEATRLVGAALRDASHPWMAHGEGSLDVRAVTVLRAHSGSRWTLRYAVRQGGEDRILIAKVYARDRGDVAATLEALRREGFGHGRCLQVAAPLAYVPALHLLLEEEAAGQPARAALRGGLPEVGERTARWLAAFHAAAPPLPAVYRLRDPVLKARHWARALGAHAPALAADGQRLLAALTEARPVWPPRDRLGCLARRRRRGGCRPVPGLAPPPRRARPGTTRGGDPGGRDVRADVPGGRPAGRKEPGLLRRVGMPAESGAASGR